MDCTFYGERALVIRPVCTCVHLIGQNDWIMEHEVCHWILIFLYIRLASELGRKSLKMRSNLSGSNTQVRSLGAYIKLIRSNNYKEHDTMLF